MMAGVLVVSVSVLVSIFGVLYLLRYFSIFLWTNMKYWAVLIAGLFLAGRIFELSRGNDISIEIPTVFPDLLAPYSQPIAAPYGIIWYAIMEAIYYLSVPLSYLFQWDNYFSISAVILLVNCPVLAYLSYYHKHLFPVYFLLSFHSWFPFTVWFTDINMPIVWLIVLGLYSRIFLVVPILAKLPVGGPIEAWQAAFFIGGHYGVVSSARYIPLIIFGLAVLAEWYDYPEKIWKTIVTRLSPIVPLRPRLVVR